MERRHITLPLTEELAKTLHAGDQVLLTGTIYTSRDAGHKRMCEALAKGEKIPFDPTDATIYYVGPTPAKPGQVIGSAGPTTSGRMDAYAPTMMSVGARGMIGKGARLPEVVEAMKKYHGVYFGAIGGAGALLAKCIKKAEIKVIGIQIWILFEIIHTVLKQIIKILDQNVIFGRISAVIRHSGDTGFFGNIGDSYIVIVFLF